LAVEVVHGPYIVTTVKEIINNIYKQKHLSKGGSSNKRAYVMLSVEGGQWATIVYQEKR
jgi:hypothetical protein